MYGTVEVLQKHCDLQDVPKVFVFLTPEPWDFVPVQTVKFSSTSFTKMHGNLNVQMLTIYSKQAKKLSKKSLLLWPASDQITWIWHTG